MRLYHYTSFESFVKIWLSKELLFSDVRKVNDLIEKTIRWNFVNMQHLPLMGAIEDGRYSYKQISLTMDFPDNIKGCLSSLMWGYYSDKTNGVCIEFESDKLQFPEDCLYSEVTYEEKVKTSIDVPPDLKTRNDVEKWLRQNSKLFFFTKQFSWKQENEFRIVANKSRSLSIANAIENVYVAKANSDTAKFVIELVNGTVPVFALSYRDRNTGIAYPGIVNAIEQRNIAENALKNKDNFLNNIRDQALSFYELHKNDWDFPLILKEYLTN